MSNTFTERKGLCLLLRLLIEKIILWQDHFLNTVVSLTACFSCQIEVDRFRLCHKQKDVLIPILWKTFTLSRCLTFAARKSERKRLRKISDGPKQNAIAMFWQNVLMAQETKEPQDEEKYILLGHNHD